MAPLKFVCANWDPGKPGCKETGTHACKNCRLVLYCGPDCQKEHWQHHKVSCRSPMSKDSWMPAWYEEGRRPSFVMDEIVYDNDPATFYFGNMPAIDVLKLSENEGASFDGKLSLLFAGKFTLQPPPLHPSGDPRSIFKTIAEIPDTRTAPISITVNDNNPDIVARNIILLLIAMVVEDVDKAVDCIIHVWYSVIIRKSDLEILQQLVKPLVQDICDKTKGKKPDAVLGKTWKFGSRSLRVELPKSYWDRLLTFFDVPYNATVENVLAARKEVARRLVDLRDRELTHMPGHTRLSVRRYLDDGILLPFGANRDEFTIPNPTFVMDNELWPKKADGLPASGWCTEAVFHTPIGGATSDSQGKLFYHIRGVLVDSLRNIARLGVGFTLLQTDALLLLRQLEHGSFSRIDSSNIADAAFCRIPYTLVALALLLQGPQDNPHATLITLFMMAVRNHITDYDRMQCVDPSGKIHALSRHYLLPSQMGPSPTTWIPGRPSNHPNIFMFGMTCEALAEYDNTFDRFFRGSKGLETGKVMSVEPKDKHTIVPKWPLKLKLKRGEPGSIEELHRLVATGLGKERYMEWKRIAAPPQ